ncbi:MAG: aminotransferase class IV [Planctomycetes bacterium]|nr:aminotransferase class IV [Planctomycetota bacterium]
MTAWVDGRFVGDGAVPRATSARPGPFETMGAECGAVRLWPHHLARLAAAAQRFGLPFAAGPELRAAAAELLRQDGHDDGILRLALVPAGTAVHVVLTTRRRSPARSVRLLPTVVAPVPGEPPRDAKLWPRPFYDAVLQQAQDGGADDGVVVDADGAVLETATGNLWLRLDGVWVTPPLDGRVLPGIARAHLLAAARRVGLPVAERACDLADLHRAEALAHGNAVYGPRAAALLPDGVPAVAIVDSELGPLWRQPPVD